MTNFLKFLLHALVSAVLLAIPAIIQLHPTWINLTVGGLLMSAYQWLIATQSPTTLGFSPKP